jgi:hypothetical protein
MKANIGIVYQVQPEAPDPARCTRFEASAVVFVLEGRVVDPESLAASYADDPDGLAEIERHSPEGGFYDSGVSVHVIGTQDGHEYLRFDIFDDDPHYHYVRPSLDHNHWIPFDPIAAGDMLPFVMRCLRERLGAMLSEAGGAEVAGDLKTSEIAEAVDRLEAAAIIARDEHRAAQANRG